MKRAKTRVERSGAVSGSQKNRAERERGAAERERSGERRSEKPGLPRSGKTFRSAPLTCSGAYTCKIAQNVQKLFAAGLHPRPRRGTTTSSDGARPLVGVLEIG